MDLQFAIRVQRLARTDMPVPGIAAELQCTEDEVMEALRAFYLPLPGERSGPAPLPPPEIREKIMESKPQKWLRGQM